MEAGGSKGANPGEDDVGSPGSEESEGSLREPDPLRFSKVSSFMPPEFYDPGQLLLGTLRALTEEELERLKRKLRAFPPSQPLPGEKLETADVSELRDLLISTHGPFTALEVTGQALNAVGLNRQSDRLRLAVVGFSPEKCLDHALRSLESSDREQFKRKLRDLPSSHPIGQARLEAAGASELRELLLRNYGRFAALEVTGQVLQAVGLKQQADWLRLAVVRFSPRKCLDYALESLEPEELQRFQLSLRGLRSPRGSGIVFGGREEVWQLLNFQEQADVGKLSWRLISYYGEEDALEVAAEMLEGIGQKDPAAWLRRCVEERAPWKRLEDTLARLGEKDLERFTRKLRHLPVQQGIERIPEAWLKGRNARQLSKSMVRFYGRDAALEMGANVLKALGQESLADNLSLPSGTDWEQNLVQISGHEVLQLESLFSKKETCGKMEKPEDLSCECNRCPSENFSETITPDVVWDSQRGHETYRFCSTASGSFHCCYTDLIFEVRGAITITYQFESWKKHQSAMEAQNLMIAGPLFNIQADPIEAVAAAYFPHILCMTSMAAEDPSQVWIAHFVEEGMSLEKPDSLGPLHAMLQNPTFSLRGAVFKKSWFKQKIKVHAMALLYQQLETAKPKFHLYLLPNDSSLKKSVHECEQKWLSWRVPKPPEIFKPLLIGSHFFLQELDEVKICPKELELKYLDADMEQQYLEVYAQRMEEELVLKVVEKNKDEVVWEACIRREELKSQGLDPAEGACGYRKTNILSGYVASEASAEESPSVSSGQHFIDRQREQLILRTSYVEGILDLLRQGDILDEEQYQRISSKETNPEKMRELYRLVPSWNNHCKDQFYKALKAKQKFLIDDLEGE